MILQIVCMLPIPEHRICAHTRIDIWWSVAARNSAVTCQKKMQRKREIKQPKKSQTLQPWCPLAVITTHHTLHSAVFRLRYSPFLTDPSLTRLYYDCWSCFCTVILVLWVHFFHDFSLTWTVMSKPPELRTYQPWSTTDKVCNNVIALFSANKTILVHF